MKRIMELVVNEHLFLYLLQCINGEKFWKWIYVLGEAIPMYTTY